MSRPTPADFALVCHRCRDHDGAGTCRLDSGSITGHAVEGYCPAGKYRQGLGDLVARVTHATGIAKVVKAVLPDCGCRKRQEALNRLGKA